MEFFYASTEPAHQLPNAARFEVGLVVARASQQREVLMSLLLPPKVGCASRTTSRWSGRTATGTTYDTCTTRCVRPTRFVAHGFDQASDWVVTGPDLDGDDLGLAIAIEADIVVVTVF